MLTPFELLPEYRDYMWGGDRLRPGQVPTAEAWVVYEQDRIAAGPLAGRSLAEAAAEFGPALLGRRPLETTGLRFPLLIKLLDCAAWLSLQVHPNDEQARALAGPGFFGKTEAWHVVEAAPGAEILCGFQRPLNKDALAEVLRQGNLLDWVRHVPLHTGDSIVIAPGMLHALGPGLLVYEVQQTSDLTYRVFDWNRPASTARPLHIEQSLAVLDTQAVAEALPQPAVVEGQAQRVAASRYFALDLLAGQTRPFSGDTRSESFHALTVLDGRADVSGEGWRQSLGRFQTLLVPAECGAYEVQPLEPLRALKAWVE